MDTQPQIQRYIRTAGGKLVPVSMPMQQKQAPVKKKLLVVVQYYPGDQVVAEELCNLIADLERTRNTSADILLFGRFDSASISPTVKQKLQSKFDTVHETLCRRQNARGYPYGPNEMFYDLCMRMSQEPTWAQKYEAWVNLESDCVPTKPGWTDTLLSAFIEAKGEGFYAIGHMNQSPTIHLNGVAVYDVNFYKAAKGSNLAGGSPSVAYDIFSAQHIVPLAKDTPHIFLDFKCPTISAENLYKPRKLNIAPVLFHGVKDNSALTVVRERYINLNSGKDLMGSTVYTYFDQVPNINVTEQKAQLTLWQEAWRSRGWNPVVLGPLDAQKNPRYNEFAEAIDRLPSVNPKGYDRACYLRWLALDTLGGGFMTDYDCIPGVLTPQNLKREAGFNVLQSTNGGSLVPSAVLADKESIAKWVQTLIDYKVDPDKDMHNNMLHTSDMHILQKTTADWIKPKELVKEVGEDGYDRAPLVHFASGACYKVSPGVYKSQIMTHFLRS